MDKREYLEARFPKTMFFVVRLYDGFDNIWIDINSEELELDEALKLWNEKTKNGTEKTCYEDIDYYDIFPFDTQMLRRYK